MWIVVIALLWLLVAIGGVWLTLWLMSTRGPMR
jgi:hypothetical protein